MPRIIITPIAVCAPFLLPLFLATFAVASDEGSAVETQSYDLSYRFEMGEVLRHRVHHSSDMRTTIDTTTQEVESTSESIKAWKVTDVLPNGDIEFVHLVEVVRMTNRVPGRVPMNFDSERDEVPPPGFEQVSRSVGVPLSIIRISPKGEIVSREEKHPQPPTSGDMPITLLLPQKAVVIGEQWDETYDVPAERKGGAKMVVRTRRVCTLKDVKNGIAVIGVDYQILTPVSAYVESQLVDRLTKGTVRFDVKRGRVVSQSYSGDKRILGFAGDTSSMHHVSRFEERLLRADERLASRR